ncbi:uncharacterized protein LOC141849515 [Brevipalpus obovatus]|uniref:uncharacterized protein LOC141849515 n=1 Tax=Brevipalpus obovatus TaxID=246614 RepID=UPI003D9F44C0
MFPEKQFEMNSVLKPSEINLLVEAKDGSSCMQAINDDRNILELSNKFMEKNLVPSLQVCEKNGNWFTLNNSLLHIIKHLEMQGKCSTIQVEVVPMDFIPETLQKCMSISKLNGISNGDVKINPSNHQTGKPEYPGIRRRSIRKLQIEENFGIESSFSHQSTTNGQIHYEVEGEGDSNTSFSDVSDYYHEYYEDDGDNSPCSCGVCDRSFRNPRQLERHQFNRGHFFCSSCDSVFLSLLNYQLHRRISGHNGEEEMDHEEDMNAPQEKILNSSPIRPCDVVERLL